MKNCRGMILFIFFAQETGFELRRGRKRVGFERLFKRVQRALIIERIDMALAGEKMRLLFLIQLAVSRAQAAAQSQSADQEQRAASQSCQKPHGLNLSEPPATFNDLFQTVRRLLFAAPGARGQRGFLPAPTPPRAAGVPTS